MAGKAEYMKEWRQTKTGREYLAASKRREKARRRAVMELVENHEEEYARLLNKHVTQVEAEFQFESRS